MISKWTVCVCVCKRAGRAWHFTPMLINSIKCRPDPVCHHSVRPDDPHARASGLWCDLMVDSAVKKDSWCHDVKQLDFWSLIITFDRWSHLRPSWSSVKHVLGTLGTDGCSLGHPRMSWMSSHHDLSSCLPASEINSEDKMFTCYVIYPTR